MRFLIFFTSGILAIAILASGSALLYEKSFGQQNLEEEVFNSLSTVAESKSNLIKSYFFDRKEDASFLSKTIGVKKIFEKRKNGNKDVVEDDIVYDLKKFQEINGYRDLFLVDNNGSLIWSTFSEDGITANFDKDVHKNVIMSEIYEKARESGEVEISDIKFENNDKVFIFVSTSVFDENSNDFIGFLILQIENSQLEKIVASKNSINDFGEIYIVNKNKINITPLKVIRTKKREDNKFYYNNNSSKITSKSIDACLKKEPGLMRNLKFYKNYAGDSILGTYQYIPDVGWCVLAEVNKNEFFKSIPTKLKSSILFFIIHNLIALVLGILIAIVLLKYFVFKKRKHKFEKSDNSFCRVAIVFFLIIVFILDVVWVYRIYFVSDGGLASQVYNNLTSVADSRVERIKYTLTEKKKEAEFLVKAHEVKELLKSEYVSKITDAKRDTDYFFKIVVKEIENYLIANPGISLKDLRKSREFREIAVQQIGQTGYSAVLNLDTLVTYFHKNQKIEDVSLKDILPAHHPLLGIMKEAGEGSGYAEGAYSWVDANGIERDKYATVINVPIKIDDYSLNVAATTYIDEYKAIKNVSKELKEYLDNFKKSFVYHNILLVSADDHIVHMAKEMEKLGVNLRYDKTGLGEGYQEYLKQDDNFFFYGPFSYHYGEIALKVALMTPVYDEDTFIGTVVLIFDMSEIIRIASELTGLGETGENYLVNKEGYLISPLRFKYFDFLVQSIKTENLSECFKYYREARERGIDIEKYEELKNSSEKKEIQIFQNYRGKQSIGMHSSISDFDWCLLTEMGQEEVFEIPRDKKAKKELIILLVVTFIMFGFVGYLKMYSKKNYVIKRKK